MDNLISRQEYEEFCRRMEDERKRTNHRLLNLEETMRQIGELTASVERLAVSVESMAKSQSRHEKRLEDLEGRDGEMWRKVSGHVLTLIIGGAVTFVLMRIGIG